MTGVCENSRCKYRRCNPALGNPFLCFLYESCGNSKFLNIDFGTEEFTDKEWGFTEDMNLDGIAALDEYEKKTGGRDK